MDKRVTHIPMPGDSGRTPTGAMQFQDDWPGLFIRGDAAISVMMAIRRLQEFLRDCQDLEVASALSVLGVRPRRSRWRKGVATCLAKSGEQLPSLPSGW